MVYVNFSKGFVFSCPDNIVVCGYREGGETGRGAMEIMRVRFGWKQKVIRSLAFN